MEFRLLGGVEAFQDGTPVDLGPARQRCVLAALLVEPNAAVPADRLIDRVWADRTPQRVRGALHSYLTRLRRALPGVRIPHGPGGYLLWVDEEAVDLHRFRALVRQARTAPDDDAAVLFEQAEALWRGEPFGDLDTPWLTTVRAGLERERVAAELDHADLELRRGGHTSLIAPLTARATRRPLDERLAAQLVLALYRAGRRADALEHHRRTRELLAEELGLDPGPHLVDLHRRVLASDPRLTDPVPRQLPAEPGLFIGRTAELDVEAPLLVISGTGGIGKTWLALRWAHSRKFPDGRLFTNLRGFDPSGEPVDPNVVLRGFLDALGVPQASIPPDQEARAGLYRSLLVERRMVIVLDNARDATQVVPLLPGPSASTVVVTSRDRLTGLTTAHGARSVVLDVLSEEDSRALLARRLGAERVVGPEVVARCGGLPLALALVAGQAAAHPEFPLGAPDDGDLSTVLSWSYNALPPELASAFRLLGSAPGPDIGVAAAAVLTGRSESALRGLERVSLLARHSPGRYRMHDLVRRYARELPDPDRPAALARLVEHYTRTACAARALLDPEPSPLPLEPEGTFTDDTAALRWFDAEHQCLLAALDEADDLTAWHLAWTLHPFLFRRGHHRWHADSWRRGLEAAERLGNRRVLAMGHQLHGYACSAVGRLDESLEHLERALELAEERRFEGHVRLCLAGTRSLRGEKVRAAAHAVEAVEIFREVGDRVWEALALNAAGWASAELGDHPRASEYCSAGLVLARADGNRYGEAAALDSLGLLAQASGAEAAAIGYYREALGLYRGLGAASSEAATLERLRGLGSGD